MNFPDYRKMKGDKSSTVTHQKVVAYLNDYAEHFQLCQFIRVRTFNRFLKRSLCNENNFLFEFEYFQLQFNTTVEHVQPEIIENDKKSPIWKVQVQNLKTSETFHKEFDAVIICTG